MLKSSTGQGIKLRITSFALIVVPIINNLLASRGANLAPENVVSFIDAFFYIVFALVHVYGWLRSFNKDKHTSQES